MINYLREPLSRTFSTITSPLFSEFVLELEWIPTIRGSAHDAQRWWGVWTELDEIFERMDIERGFRVVIRAQEVGKKSNLIVQAKDRLPLMAARKGITFEIGRFPER